MFEFAAGLCCRTGLLRSVTPHTKTRLRGPRFARPLRGVYTPLGAAPVGRFQFRRFVGAGLVCLDFFSACLAESGFDLPGLKSK